MAYQQADNDEQDGDGDQNGEDSGTDDDEDESFAGLEMDAATVPIYIREIFNQMMVGVDFARHRAVCVEGEQGSGKSVLLRWLMWAACKAQLGRMDLLLGKSIQEMPDDNMHQQLQDISGNGSPREEKIEKADLERRERELKRLQRELKVREGRPDFYLPVLLPMHRVGVMMQKKKLWGGTDDVLLHWLEEEYGSGTGMYRLLKELRKNRL
jgi:hypothetical protein